jgi:uncharacterized protein (TIGR02145 family)
MRKKILVLLSIALVLSANSRAQVTIGGLVDPANGAILDLNKTVKGGLALSNVDLPDFHTIPNGFPGIASQADVTTAVKSGFRGALVYNTGVTSPPAGIYVWNGTNWTPVGENCLSAEDLTLTLTASSIVPAANVPVTFTVSSNASARCAGSETYTWSVPGANTGDYIVLSPPGNRVTIQFITTGAYTVKVVVRNSYSTGTATAETAVVVGGVVPASWRNNSYGIVGETCLDVKNSRQPDTQSTEAFNARKDAFEGSNYEKAYRFIHGDAFSNLSFSYDAPENIVVDFTPPSVTAASGSGEKIIRIKFNSNIKNLVPDTGDSLTVKLIASYNIIEYGSSVRKLAYLEIRVEDGTCVCPAKVSATEWRNFMCHNLGGLDIISSSQLITRAHLGDWYRFGAALPSMVNLQSNDNYSNFSKWDNKPVVGTNGSDWPNTSIDAYGIGNPCPAGWRVPDIYELGGILSRNPDHTAINPANNTYSPHGSWGTYGAMLQVGDFLYLPSVGYRNTTYGEWVSQREGRYWSSTGNSYAAYGVLFDDDERLMNNSESRGAGLSVRCVAD